MEIYQNLLMPLILTIFCLRLLIDEHLNVVTFENCLSVYASNNPPDSIDFALFIPLSKYFFFW